MKKTEFTTMKYQGSLWHNDNELYRRIVQVRKEEQNKTKIEIDTLKELIRAMVSIFKTEQTYKNAKDKILFLVGNKLDEK